MDHSATQRFYDRISSVYDLIAHSSEREAQERGLAALSVRAGTRVLEVGYGTGRALVELARAVGPGGHVEGIDISGGMERIAKERVEKAGLENVSFTLGPVPPVPFPDASLDAAFLSFTLELFPLEEIPRLLEEIRRAVRPGGRVGIVSMARPLPDEKESLIERSYQWMHRHFPHIVDCQPIEGDRYLEDAGFRIVHSERVSIWTLPVAILVGARPE